MGHRNDVMDALLNVQEGERMKEKYRVVQILEDDFGCEERQEDQETMVIVILADAFGNSKTIRQTDSWMYHEELGEGDEAFLIDDKLRKALGANWTEQCNNMNVPQFLELMERLKKGEQCNCPFCGGTVSMTEGLDGKYKYACDSCDMYFETELK
ncbi:MAG: hypothetical protein EOM34_12895 [Clostridia bacterium]|nr:hypothetical protein [Anaerostipes sp.]NCC01549.1 hypothetical protein [Clostridia bacterium]